ncbi:MAG: hypothetical protein HY748_08510 [Elusimicrobia bacterium]|nr:hypothetical protein [Elusimicrobiota bacterium]
MFGSILIQISLVAALLAYFLDGKEWYAAAERYLDERARARMLEPYRAWASRHPQTYEDVAASGAGFIGKAVSWDFAVDLSSGEASYYCEGDLMKKVAWTAVDPRLREKAAGGLPVQALARIEGTQGDLPFLTALEVR